MAPHPHRWGPPWRGAGWRWGLWAPRILRILLFRNPKGETTKSPCVFAERSSGTTTCEHSQELTPGLLELKVTGIFTASMPFTAVSRLRATPVVMGSLATVPPGDRFLSPVPNGRVSYERGSRSTHVYRLETFSSLNVLSI